MQHILFLFHLNLQNRYYFLFTLFTIFQDEYWLDHVRIYELLWTETNVLHADSD